MSSSQKVIAGAAVGVVVIWWLWKRSRKSDDSSPPVLETPAAGASTTSSSAVHEQSEKVQAVQPSKELSFEEKLLQYCRDLLPSWDDEFSSEITLAPLTGGLSNTLYIAEHKKHGKVVLRIFGTGMGVFLDEMQERRVYAFLHPAHPTLHKVVPSLQTTFPGGRFEAFLSGRTLHVDDLSESKIAQQVARRIADLHRQTDVLSLVEQGARPRRQSVKFDNVDRKNLSPTKVSRPATFVPVLEVFLKKWLALVHADALSDPMMTEIADIIDLDVEVKWLIERARKTKSPVVFCHNDAQEGNWIQDEEHKKLTLIDFEYAGPNYRAFDLGNFLCEVNMNNAADKYPGFDLMREKEPGTVYTRTFLVSYAEQFLIGEDLTEDSVDVLLKQLYTEVPVFILASHLMWVVWAIAQHPRSPVSDDFSYLQYALTRTREYQRRKKILQDKE